MSSEGAEAVPRRGISDAARTRLVALADRAAANRIPLTGSIAMTHRCHLACVHCYLGPERFLSGSEAGELDTAFWLRIIDELAAAGCLNLLFTGGEALLRRDFAEVYRRAVLSGILVSVFTNGTLVDEAILRLFSDLPPQVVEISLYGASAGVFEAVSGRPGSFDRCLRGIEGLLARRIPLALKAVVLRENQHEIPAMRRLAAERGLDFRIDPSVFPCLSGDRGPLEHRIPAEEAVALEMDDDAQVAASVRILDSKARVPFEGRLFVCYAGVTAFHIGPQGVLLPCLMTTTHGFDLTKGSLLDGWNGPLADFHDQVPEPGFECNSCDRRLLCGFCPAQAGLETGSPHVKADYTCQLGQARLAAIETHKSALDKRTPFSET